MRSVEHPRCIGILGGLGPRAGLAVLDQLLTSGFLDPLLEDDSSTFPSELLSLVKVIQSPFLA